MHRRRIVEGARCICPLYRVDYADRLSWVPGLPTHEEWRCRNLLESPVGANNNYNLRSILSESQQLIPHQI